MITKEEILGLGFKEDRSSVEVSFKLTTIDGQFIINEDLTRLLKVVLPYTSKFTHYETLHDSLINDELALGRIEELINNEHKITRKSLLSLGFVEISDIRGTRLILDIGLGRNLYFLANLRVKDLVLEETFGGGFTKFIPLHIDAYHGELTLIQLKQLLEFFKHEKV